MPEILDHLAADDPRALRSRRDLRLINRCMGNHRWILHEMRTLVEAGLRHVVEIGAGDGMLLARILREFPSVTATAIDLQDPEESMVVDARMNWVRGDLLQADVDFAGAVVISNLFLHHFLPEELATIGQRIRGAGALLACEPERRALHLWQGWMAGPAFNATTRHDLAVSVRAGFRHDELLNSLMMGNDWHWHQTRTWLGAHRLKGVRQ